LVDQGGGNYYTPAVTNVGDGYISGLTLLDDAAITQIWHIKCVYVPKDGYGEPVPNTAKFVAIGSVSGPLLDGYLNPIFWLANGVTVVSTIFSFAIFDGIPSLRENDEFIIEVAGQTPGIEGGRGYNNTTAQSHTTDGYDGYVYWDPLIRLFVPGEDNRFDRIFICQNRFEYPNFPFTATDGYHQVTKDLLSSDLAASDAANVDFPMYDFSGYHRTDPVQILNGTCVGSYIGGEMGCIDGYGNVQILRGLSLQDQNTQRQEVELTVTGRVAVLIKRVQTGITCSCYLASSEYPDDRCPFCYGTKFVFGYEQYFNPRRSDGRILVRPGPTDEQTKMYEAGLESEFPLSLWTLTVPTIKTRDIIILFDIDDNEEFRYEVTTVTRNNTILGQQGGQLFKVMRIRKYDPAYQIRVFRNTADFPSKLNTTLGAAATIIPHTHEIVISEKIVSVNQINQTTAMSQGQNHPIVNGVVMPVLGHTHNIILV
jgi:hypothetical protein